MLLNLNKTRWIKPFLRDAELKRAEGYRGGEKNVVSDKSLAKTARVP